VLIEDDGEVTPEGRPICAGWKANVPNGHCVVNRTNADVLLLEVGNACAS